MIPYYDGRVGAGLKVLGQRTSDEDYSQILPSLKRPHMDYMHDFYGDTAMFGGGVAATRCGYEFFGADRAVFATDTPLEPAAPVVPGLNDGGSLAGKLSSELMVTSSSSFSIRLRSSSACCFGFSAMIT